MRRTITTLQAPACGFGAFAPTPAVIPSASSAGLMHTEGYPGTRKVPSPAPQFPSASGDDGNGRANKTQNSNAGAPDWFLPCIYIPHMDNMGPENDIGMAILIDNVVPAPSVNPVRVPQQNPLRARVGGQTATAWPRPMVRWPTYGGGAA
jgi:hypothetical protein